MKILIFFIIIIINFLHTHLKNTHLNLTFEISLRKNLIKKCVNKHTVMGTKTARLQAPWQHHFLRTGRSVTTLPPGLIKRSTVPLTSLKAPPVTTPFNIVFNENMF